MFRASSSLRFGREQLRKYNRNYNGATRKRRGSIVDLNFLKLLSSERRYKTAMNELNSWSGDRVAFSQTTFRVKNLRSSTVREVTPTVVYSAVQANKVEIGRDCGVLYPIVLDWKELKRNNRSTETHSRFAAGHVISPAVISFYNVKHILHAERGPEVFFVVFDDRRQVLHVTVLHRCRGQAPNPGKK